MIAAPRVSRDISVVTQRGRSLSPAARRFIEVLRAELAAGEGAQDTLI